MNKSLFDNLTHQNCSTRQTVKKCGVIKGSTYQTDGVLHGMPVCVLCAIHCGTAPLVLVGFVLAKTTVNFLTL